MWGVFVSASLFGGNQLLLIFFYYSELSISVRSNKSGEGRWDSEFSLEILSADGVASAEYELP